MLAKVAALRFYKALGQSFDWLIWTATMKTKNWLMKRLLLPVSGARKMIKNEVMNIGRRRKERKSSRWILSSKKSDFFHFPMKCILSQNGETCFRTQEWERNGRSVVCWSLTFSPIKIMPMRKDQFGGLLVSVDKVHFNWEKMFASFSK